MTSSQASFASSSRFAVSRFIDCDSLLLHRLAKVRVDDLLFGDDLDRPFEQRFQSPREPQVALGDTALVPAEVGDEVDVTTVRFECAGGRGAEHFQLADAELAAEVSDGIPVGGDEIDHGNVSIALPGC